MFRRCSPPALFITATLALAGCAAMNGRAAFSRAEKAHQRGDLTTAIREYRLAVDADPKRDAYRAALTETQREAAGANVEAARRAEAARDFAGAVEQWDRALEVLKDDPELKARRALAELRTHQADPVEFYRAAVELKKTIPNDPGAQATLHEAKKTALGYHLRLAQVYADAESWAQAFQEYQVAHEIEPDHAVFTSGMYVRTQARHLEVEGDELLAKGDALGAYQAFEQASRLSPSRSIVQKMRRAKRGAGSTLEQLDQARRYEQQNKWEDAAELYTVMAASRSAPIEVQDRARIAREKSALVRSKRAEDYAVRGFAEKGAAELTLALEHTDAPAKVLDLLAAAIEELNNGAPGLAKPKIEAALAQAPGVQVALAAKTVMATVARVEFEAAKSRGDAAPAQALVALRRLAPFAEALPGYEAAKKKLVRRAFGELVERASAGARQHKFEEATEQLATALEIAKAPAALASHLGEGMASLEHKDYAAARARFGRAVEVDGRSKLARLGLEIATSARLDELQKQAAEARVVEDSTRAAAAYRAILEITPDDQGARAGIEELKAELAGEALEAARDHQAAGRLGAAFIYYRRVLDVDPEQAEAKQAMAKIERSLGFGSEPDGYVAPAIRGDHLGDACRGVESHLRDRMVLYLNRTPKLGAAFLAAHETEDVDQKTRQLPPVTLRSAVESCDPTPKGRIVLTVQLLLGSKVVMQEHVDAGFDTKSIPKDELEDGVDAHRVLEEMISTAAKEVSLKVRSHGAALADWRTVEAQALMQADDAEGVAEIYASLLKDERLSDGDRRTMKELERFLLNRFR